MNTTKSVYNRLFKEDKVELASERVELSIIDDVNDLYNKAVVLSKGQIANIDKVISGIDASSKLFYEVVKASKDIEIKAKELGADDIVKEMQNVNKFSQEFMKSNQGIASQLQSIKSKL